jgi:hypothetical protein
LASIDDVLVIANWTPWSFLCTWFCHIGHTENKKSSQVPLKDTKKTLFYITHPKEE